MRPSSSRGHAHNGMPAPLSEDGRVVARVKAYGEEIGRLELHVNVTRKVSRILELEAAAGESASPLPCPGRRRPGEGMGGQGRPHR